MFVYDNFKKNNDEKDKGEESKGTYRKSFVVYRTYTCVIVYAID